MCTVQKHNIIEQEPAEEERAQIKHKAVTTHDMSGKKSSRTSNERRWENDPFTQHALGG